MTDFNSEKLPLEWNYLRYPNSSNYTLIARKGYLRLTGSDQTIENWKSPTFLGRRVQDMNFTATTLMEFYPQKDNEVAGITLLNNGAHFDLLVKQSKGNRVLVCRLHFGNVVHDSEEFILKPGPVKLIVKGERTTFSFGFVQGNDSFKEVQKVPSKFLSSETAGGFTGLYVGIYATGNGKVSRATADYDWFEYLKQ